VGGKPQVVATAVFFLHLALYPRVVENKVAYVIGSAFYCNGKGQNTMRLNFSFPSEKQIEEGIKRLAKMVREDM
jgi:2-aminoadipate transaminase